MSDCPEKLTTGVSLIVTLHFYIVASAFTPLRTSNSDELPKLTFNEGAETNEETCVRNQFFFFLRIQTDSCLIVPSESVKQQSSSCSK